MNPNLKVLIYGLGRSGRGVAKFVRGLGWSAQWIDQNPQPQDLELMAALEIAEYTEGLIPEWVIAAPGVPIDHSDLERFRAGGAKVIGELELGYLTRRTPMIGITGTAGKGSTSSLITQILQGLGIQAKLGGNFDPPLLEIIDHCEVAVVEISSFQLERVQTFRPCVGVITNLGVDHLNRHRTVQVYHAEKHKLLERQNPDDLAIFPRGLEVGGLGQKLPFDPQPHSILDLEGNVLLEGDQIPAAHYPANLQAAVYAALGYLKILERPVEPAQLLEVIAGLQPLEGRFQSLGFIGVESGQVEFIEDSIATRTLAVKTALERAKPPIAWIMGGRDKGAELEPLRQVVQDKVKFILAIGSDGAKLASSLEVSYAPVTQEVSLETGFSDMLLACQMALEVLPEGGTVLLAPLCESFDQFKDYKDRAKAFRQAFEIFKRESLELEHTFKFQDEQ